MDASLDQLLLMYSLIRPYTGYLVHPCTNLQYHLPLCRRPIVLATQFSNCFISKMYADSGSHVSAKARILGGAI